MLNIRMKELTSKVTAQITKFNYFEANTKLRHLDTGLFYEKNTDYVTKPYETKIDKLIHDIDGFLKS